MDAITPLLAVTLASFYLSQYASGDAFGLKTSLPWGIYLWGAKRHPIQLYNFVAAIGILTMICYPKKKGRALSPPGSTFILFLTLSAGARLALDAFREDVTLTIFRIRVSQLIAWFVLAVSTFVSDKLAAENKKLQPPTAD
jgi:prolipoprotein diacylglyceryltransferase